MTSPIDAMAEQLSALIGRTVKVARNQSEFRQGKFVRKSAVRYTLWFDGVEIPFGTMSANEVKARIDMIIDLVHHGVFNVPDSTPKDRSHGGNQHGVSRHRNEGRDGSAEPDDY